MSYVNPLAKLEAAGVALATAVAPAGYTVSAGEDDGTITASQIIVVAEDLKAEPGMEDYGNWRATLRVVVKSNAADTGKQTHQDNCSTVFSAFVVDTLASQLTAATTEFTCQFALFSDGTRTISDGQSWRDEITFTCMICSQTLAGY